jgi:hypothetical protein
MERSKGAAVKFLKFLCNDKVYVRFQRELAELRKFNREARGKK